MRSLSEIEARVVREFTFNILHGDDTHRDWLLEAAEAFIKGKPLPRVRSAKPKPVKKSGEPV